MTGRVLCVFLLAVVCTLAITGLAPRNAGAKSRKSDRSARSHKSHRSGKSGKSCTSDRCEPPPPVEVCVPGQLAAVVFEVSADGDLRITGDACDATLTLTPGPTRDALTLSVDAGTSLGGVPGPTSATAAGVVGDVWIDMGAGNDSVLVERVDSPGDLHIDQGSGANRVRFVDVDVAGDVSLRGGDGNDVFGGPSIRIVGSMLFDVGAGGNNLALDLTTGADLTIRTGDGDDSIRLSDFSGSGGTLWIDAGGGANTLRLVAGTHVGADLQIRAGDGGDVLEVLSCATVAGTVRVELGGGPDTAVFLGLTADQDVWIDMGGGADELTFGASAMQGGIPACACELGGATTLLLGAGDDVLSTEDTAFVGPLLADGGPGSDVRYELLGTVYLVPPLFLDFEAVAVPWPPIIEAQGGGCGCAH